jgi:hypothetical protein
VSSTTGSRRARLLGLAITPLLVLPPTAGASWAQYQFAGITFGSGATRLDLIEADAGVGIDHHLPIGVGIGTSLFRGITANRTTGMSVWGGLPLDVDVVLPLAEGEPGNMQAWLRLFGSGCFWGFSMNKVAPFASGRWYGGGAGLYWAPAWAEMFAFGAEAGWQRVQNTYRDEDNSMWYWGVRVECGFQLAAPDR